MWSLLNTLPIFKPAVKKPIEAQKISIYPLLISSEISSSTSSSPERTIKRATAAKEETPFCCHKDQIPSSTCPTSHNLTLFLRALTLRQQEIQHTNTLSSMTFFQPLIRANISCTSSKPMIIELETSTNSKSPKRIFTQRYFVPRQGLQRKDVEMYPEGAFFEISLKEVQRIKRPSGGWEFLKKDEVARDRVVSSCEECGAGYWVRVVANGESVSVFRDREGVN